MPRRVLGGLLAALLAANAVAMLAAPAAWYVAVPGVSTTGPYNPHFVADIGAAYLAVAAGLAAFAACPALGWPALAVAALFLDVHALIHVRDAALSSACGRLLAQATPGVFLPALIASFLLLPARSAQFERTPS